jgi:3-oxoacyl-[acyl-carrier protein] reductase
MLAHAFAAEGARVGLTYTQREGEAAKTAEAIRSAGGSCSVHKLDVRDREQVDAVVTEFSSVGSLDVLVNNAATLDDQPVAVMDRQAWDTVVATNLTGTFNCSRAVLVGMMARRTGTIVNVVSVSAFRASPGQANYSASKAGVVGLTRTMAAEVGRYGVRVNAVMPGLLDLGMGARLDHRVVRERVEAIHLGRLGRGEEVAASVLFLASDEASYITGQILGVDGGLAL